MPVKSFTVQWVANLPPPKERTDFFDTKVVGLGLRISPVGKKSWFVMYRVKGDPKKRRLTLDPYPAMTLANARERAREVLLAAQRGLDPAIEKQGHRHAASFASLADEYLEKHAKRKKRSWREDARVIHRELLPKWRGRKACDIRRTDVHALLDEVVDRGSSIQANRTLALIRKIYNWGIGRGTVEHNPCLHIEAPAAENQRQRVLSEDEIRALWRGFDFLGPAMSAMFKLRLLTAQRGGEVSSMRWTDIDLNSGRSWTIPPQTAKNGLAHFVPLSHPALEILRSLKAGDRTDSDWVFPSPKIRRLNIQNVQKAAARLRAYSGVQDFVLHDLRRTAASYMTSAGISRLVVSKILNHVEYGVTRVYDRHSYDDEKRAALDKWALMLCSILTHNRNDETPKEAA